MRTFFFTLILSTLTFANGLKDLEESLKGYLLLLKAETQTEKKITLENNIQRLYYKIGKLHLLNKNKDLGIENFNSSIVHLKNLIDLVSLQATTSVTLKVSIHHSLAMDYIELGQKEEARKQFEKALALDANSSLSPAMNLYLGESYFDEENFRKAAEFYILASTKLPLDQRGLAKYKLAWCYTRLDQMTNAIAIFVELAKNKQNLNYQSESLKDLAFLLSKQKKESEIIDWVNIAFKTNIDLQSIFYGNLLDLELNNKEISYPKIRNIWLNTEPNSESRKRYLFTQLRRSDLAIDTFLTNLEFLKSLKINHEETIETFQLISNRISLLTKDLSLKSSKTADISLSENIIRLIKKAEALNQDHKESNDIAKILAYQTLNKGIDSYPRELNQAFYFFYENHQSSPQWSLISGQYAQWLIEHEKNEEAEKILDKIYRKNKTKENLWNLALHQFKMGRYSLISKIELKKIKEDEWKEKFQSLKRESSLRMAEKNKNDITLYKKNIDQFLALNKDQEKEVIAKKDYFQKLIEKKMYLDLKTELLKISEKDRLFTYAREAHILISFLKEAEDWKAIGAILTSPSLGFETDYYLGKLIENNELEDSSWASLKRMPQLLQDQILSYWLLLNPSDLETKAAYYSIKLSVEIRKIQDQLKSWNTPVQTTFVGKPLEWPRANYYSKSYEDEIIKKMKQVREIRVQLVKDLENIPLVDQIARVIYSQKIEFKMASVIVSGPFPKELTGNERNKYQKGLEDLALEFRNQSKEFEKLAEKLQSKAESSKETEMSSFKRNLKKLKSELNNKNINSALKNMHFISAIARNDSLIESKKISNRNYYLNRVQILFSAQPTITMIKYIKSELKLNNQDSLLEELGRI